MPLHPIQWRRGGVGCLVAAALLVAAPAAAAEDALPTTEAKLVEAVRTAIVEHDIDTFERLINWEGASPIKRRIVGFEVRRGMGRPILSIGLEPFPDGGLQKIEAGGSLRANMPVTHQLRVVYDEPPMEEYGIRPTAVFLVGRHAEAFRIALVVRAQKDND